MMLPNTLSISPRSTNVPAGVFVTPGPGCFLSFGVLSLFLPEPGPEPDSDFVLTVTAPALTAS
jgi:hypothetical protein